MKFFNKKKSFFHSNFLLFIFSLLLTTSILFFCSLQIQKQLLIKNIFQQSEEIGDTWIELLDVENINFHDYNPYSQENKYLIKQLTFLSETNENIGQAYFFGAEIKNNQETMILASPQIIFNKGYKLGDYYKQPSEWISCAETVLKTKRPAYSKVYSDVLGEWITTLHPIFNAKGEIVAFFGVDMNASIIQDGQNELIIWLGSILIFMFIITIYLHYLGLKRLFSPLRDLLHGISEVSSGNFHIEIKVNEKDELSLLSSNFNIMVKYLREVFDSLSQTYQVIEEKVDENILIPGKKNNVMFKQNPGISDALRNLEFIRERTLLIEEIQRRENIHSIRQLAAVFAHDFRNPSTTIQGFLKLFSQQDDIPRKYKEIIEMMVSEMATIVKKVDDYVEFAQNSIDKKVTLNLSDNVNSILDMVFKELNKKIHLKQLIEPSLFINANKFEVTLLLTNLIQNSIEALIGGGTLSINAYKKDNNILLEIKDDGIGMTKEQLRKLGTPFYSIKAKGTGIGLMKVFHIVDKLNGNISISSKEAEGTIVRIAFPAA
jgi:two-component system, sporulation sensor kinase B